MLDSQDYLMTTVLDVNMPAVQHAQYIVALSASMANMVTIL